MKGRNIGSSIAAVLGLVLIHSMAGAQTLTIGTDSAKPGQAVQVPVILSAGVDSAAALVRIDYDADKMENPSALAGPLVGAGHALDAFSPEPGRLNVAVYPPAGAPALTAQSGILFYLVFDIKAGATSGATPLALTTAGPPALPALDLTAADGSSLTPTLTAGSVTILAKSSAHREWLLYE